MYLNFSLPFLLFFSGNLFFSFLSLFPFSVLVFFMFRFVIVEARIQPCISSRQLGHFAPSNFQHQLQRLLHVLWEQHGERPGERPGTAPSRPAASRLRTGGRQPSPDPAADPPAPPKGGRAAGPSPNALRSPGPHRRREGHSPRPRFTPKFPTRPGRPPPPPTHPHRGACPTCASCASSPWRWRPDRVGRAVLARTAPPTRERGERGRGRAAPPGGLEVRRVALQPAQARRPRAAVGWLGRGCCVPAPVSGDFGRFSVTSSRVSRAWPSSARGELLAGRPGAVPRAALPLQSPRSLPRPLPHSRPRPLSPQRPVRPFPHSRPRPLSPQRPVRPFPHSPPRPLSLTQPAARPSCSRGDAPCSLPEAGCACSRVSLVCHRWVSGTAFQWLWRDSA